LGHEGGVAGNPVPHHDAATGSRDPNELLGHVERFWREHRAEDTHHEIEALVVEPAQIACVALLEAAVVQAELPRPCVPRRNERRKPLIVAGMQLQAAALATLALSGGRFSVAAVAAVILGVGTALVYPTLIAAISDVVVPIARAPTVGVYRFWRDMGYAVGGVIAGTVSDALGFGGAIAVVAGLTAASGLWVAVDLRGAEGRAGDTRRVTRRGALAGPSGLGRPRSGV
jgi:MFS family permease